MIAENTPLKIVNHLTSYTTVLDLTLLIEQFTSNTLNFIQTVEDSETKADKSIINIVTASNLMFMRLNLPAVNGFAKSYIKFLNTNLIFFED